MKQKLQYFRDSNESLLNRLRRLRGDREMEEFVTFGELVSLEDHMAVRSKLIEKIKSGLQSMAHIYWFFRFLEAKFGGDYLLANALYESLSVDVMCLSGPTRIGHLTKQGGTVKSWKRA